MGFLNFLKSQKATTIPTDPFDDGNYCLQKIVDNWDVTNPDRYSVFLEVLTKSQKYGDPLHILACAYACHYSKAEYRIQAIQYFEKYLENPILSKIPQFNLSNVHCDLGKDYESEYDLKNAEKHYIASLQFKGSRLFNSRTQQYEIFSEEIMLGRLYLKIGTQSAIDYWKKLMDYEEYKTGNSDEAGFRRSVDIEYKNALAKHEKGYVYKPRKKKQV